MVRPQWFYGFMGAEGGKTKIDVVAILRLSLPSMYVEGEMVEVEVLVRVAPDQDDELLLPPRVLDGWRWVPLRTTILFPAIGAKVKRIDSGAAELGADPDEIRTRSPLAT